MLQTLCVVITFDKCVTLTLTVINLIYIYALFKMLVNCKKKNLLLTHILLCFFFCNVSWNETKQLYQSINGDHHSTFSFFLKITHSSLICSKAKSYRDA